MRMNEFCNKERFWETFVYASTNANERQGQWEELKRRKQFWSDKWIIEGDFNDIKGYEEKRG